MHPLRFEPLFRRYIWGGHRLATVLNKPTGDETCAESWEVVDHDEDQSIVRYGSFAGKSLANLISEHGVQLLGETALATIFSPDIPSHLQGRFPLLLKFLDANRSLSVQVHPDDEIGASLNPPDLGKTEAWYVMHADPGSKIYSGLKAGVTKEQFAIAIKNGTTETLLHCFEPNEGDCVFIKAGTLHAIGEGILIAEIQQASDTTFRVFDWNRTDENGNSRDLHIEQSLNAINFDLGPVNACIPSIKRNAGCQTLVECEKFVMRKWNIEQPIQFDDGKLHILAITKGRAVVENDPSGAAMTIGETVLLPASCGTTVTPQEHAEILEVFLPS